MIRHVVELFLYQGRKNTNTNPSNVSCPSTHAWFFFAQCRCWTYPSRFLHVQPNFQLLAQSNVFFLGFDGQIEFQVHIRPCAQQHVVGVGTNALWPRQSYISLFAHQRQPIVELIEDTFQCGQTIVNLWCHSHFVHRRFCQIIEIIGPNQRAEHALDLTALQVQQHASKA